MFKRFLFTLLSLLIVSTNAYALPVYSRGGNCLTGGTPGCLDSYDGATLNDGDVVFIITGAALYVYSLDADSALAESSPDVIAPDTAPGDKRWILQSIAYDSTLTSIASLGTAADKGIYTTGVDTWAEFGLTAFARSILDDANEATFKATVNLEIGTDVQGYDSNLDDVAGLSSADSNIIVGSATGWVAESGGTARTSLGVAIGSDVLAYDAGIQNLAGVAMAADKFYYTSADNTHIAGSVTAAGRAILDDANAAAQIATLGLDADIATLSLPASTTISVAGAALIDDANAAAQATTLGLGTGNSPTFVTAKLSGLTDGYIPYHVADATGLANSVIFTDGTYVGIGTATPGSYKLNVNGVSNLNGVYVGMADSKATITSEPAGTDLRLKARAGDYDDLVVDTSGNVSINHFYAGGTPWYDVKHYGAVGDNSNDDTSAIQAAINAAIADTPAVVYFPPGTYKTSAVIGWGSTNNNIAIIGGGPNQSIIMSSVATGNIMQINGSSGIYLNGFRIDSSVDKTAGTALYFNSLTRSRIENVLIAGQDSANTYLHDGIWFDQVDQVWFSNFEIKAANHALKVNGGAGAVPKAGLYVHGGRILGTPAIAIHVGGGFGGFTVDDLDISSAVIGLKIDQAIVPGEGNREVFLGPGVTIDGCSSSGIYINDDTLLVVKLNGTWIAAGNGGGTVHGIHVVAHRGFINISAPLITGNSGDGIRVDTALSHVNITGGFIWGNGGYGLNVTVVATLVHVNGVDFDINTAGAINGDVTAKNHADSLLNGIRVGMADSKATITSEPAGTDLRLKARAGDYDDLVVDTSGNVGISMAAPVERLHIRNTAVNSDVGIKIGNDERDWNLKVMGSISDSFQIFTHDNSNVLTILSSGNVGIGITTPQGVLQVKKSSDVNLLVSTHTAGHITLSGVNDANSANIPLEFRGSAINFSTGNVTMAGTLTVNGDQTGATDHVFDDYDDIELLRKWRKGEKLPFEIGDILNRDRLLRDAIIQLEKRVTAIQELSAEVAANKITIQELTERVLKLESSKN